MLTISVVASWAHPRTQSLWINGNGPRLTVQGTSPADEVKGSLSIKCSSPSLPILRHCYSALARLCNSTSILRQRKIQIITTNINGKKVWGTHTVVPATTVRESWEESGTGPGRV